MQAVVFKGTLQVAPEKRPLPKIQEATDVIVKVRYSALCGRRVSEHTDTSHEPTNIHLSELHVFRAMNSQARSSKWALGFRISGKASLSLHLSLLAVEHVSTAAKI